MMATAASRLLRAYAAQVEILRRLRNGGSQTVRVEHVHMNGSSQAVVGDVRVTCGSEAPAEFRYSHSSSPHLPYGFRLGQIPRPPLLALVRARSGKALRSGCSLDQVERRLIAFPIDAKRGQ
jgi:hypothetical protein